MEPGYERDVPEENLPLIVNVGVVVLHAMAPADRKQEVTFTAKRGLASRLSCQLHPAHIGG